MNKSKATPYIRLRCEPAFKIEAEKLAMIHSEKTGIDVNLSNFIRFLIKKYKAELSTIGGIPDEF